MNLHWKISFKHVPITGRYCNTNPTPKESPIKDLKDAKDVIAKIMQDIKDGKSPSC